ncbi:hypothetical protein DID88_001946 [Monilinia fructigena]|uniref:Uncharacterized protein n=1 Tax=Monilinia fructigena TaxID=38457 RepID=A0A395IW08_9HELO|nr:hypothetical protein DID88_001946 [Monilinia fructigena]
MRLCETREAGQTVQDDTHHTDMHTFPKQSNSTLINAPPVLPWNGVPASVVPYEYNNTLPESDDKNFNFDNYSPTKQLTEEVNAVASHDTTYSAPEYPLVVPLQATSSVLKDWLTTPRHTTYAARGGLFLTASMVRDVERVEAKISNPDFDTIETLTETQRKAEKRVMKMIKEVENKSKFQSIDQEEPMEDVLHIQDQTDALLQESSLLQISEGKATEELLETEDQLKFQAIKQEDIMEYVSVALQVQEKSDALIQESRHFQERPQRKAMRKLQKIEHESNIQGNKSMRDILHDQTQLDTFLQDFTYPQQEIAREMWMGRKDKANEKYSKLFITTAAVNWENSHRPQSNNKINHHPEDTHDKFSDETDEEQHHLQNGNIHSGDQMNTFQRSYPVENQKMAREIWLAEVPIVSNDLRKSLNRMSRFGIKPGEESKIVGDDHAEKNQRAQNMIRASTRSMRPKQKINYEELQKQMALSKPRLKYRKNRRRDFRFLDSEHKLQVKNEEARKKRMRDLYYSGLISSMNTENSGGEKLQLDSVDEEQNNRESQLEYHSLLMVKHEEPDEEEEELQAANLNEDQDFMEFDRKNS